jgi:hypothetical protein
MTDQKYFSLMAETLDPALPEDEKINALLAHAEKEFGLTIRVAQKLIENTAANNLLRAYVLNDVLTGTLSAIQRIHSEWIMQDQKMEPSLEDVEWLSFMMTNIVPSMLRILEPDDYDWIAGKPTASQNVAQPAVEALDEAVLLWFAGCNVVPPDAGLVGPVQDGVRGQLRAVVTDDRIRASPSPANNVVQLTRHAPAGDRGVGDQGEALSGAVVDHRQDAEAPSVGELVRDEVQAPALIGGHRRRDRPPGPHRPLAAAAPAHRQSLLAIEPLHPLLVDGMAFPPQQYM